jgi:hypothetical protein
VHTIIIGIAGMERKLLFIFTKKSWKTKTQNTASRKGKTIGTNQISRLILLFRGNSTFSSTKK